MGALEIVPHVVHDLKGQSVPLSHTARRAVAALIEDDQAYIYVAAGPDRDFYNIWFNHEVDATTGYCGVRVPLADWVRAFDMSQDPAWPRVGDVVLSLGKLYGGARVRVVEIGEWDGKPGYRCEFLGPGDAGDTRLWTRDRIWPIIEPARKGGRS